MSFRTLYSVVLILSLLFGSCARDPETRKKKHLANGNKYFENGKFREASIMYRNALKEDARFGEAYYRLALTELKLGRIGEAISAFRRSIELQPENMDAHAKMSDILLLAYRQNPKRNAQALKELQDIAVNMEKRAPNSYDTLRLRGFLLLADNKLPEALASFEKADKAKPNVAELQTTMALTLFGLNRPEEAIQRLDALMKSDKANPAPYDLLYAYNVRNKNVAEAERIAQLRVTNNPKQVEPLIALARHFAATKQDGKMLEVLNGILSRDKEFPGAFGQVGDFYVRVGNLDKAGEALRAGIQKNDDRKTGLQKRLIEVLSLQGRVADAQTLVDEVLKADPKDPEAIAIRASLWLNGGKPDQLNAAIADLQSVVSKMPENFVLRFNLGRALMVRGDLDAAKMQLQDVLKMRPDYFPARVALAQVSLRKHDWNTALQLSADVLRQDPGNMYARLIRSHALMAMNQYPEAQALLKETIEKFPKAKDAQYQMGYLLFKGGKFKEAETMFKEVYYTEPVDLRGLLGLIETYMAEKQFDLAMKTVDAEVAKYPEALAFQVAQGTVAIRAGQYDKAIEVLRKVAAKQTNAPDLYMRLAEAQRLKGDIAGALESWRKAADLSPNFTAPVLNRATTLDMMRRRSEARPLYEQVLRIEPDNVLALNNLAYLLAEDGADLDTALTMAQRAKQKAPNDPMVSDTLGWVYIKKGLANNAVSIFNELTAKHPTVATFHYHQAVALLQRGDKAQARKAIDLALRNNPHKQELEEIKKFAEKLG